MQARYSHAKEMYIVDWIKCMVCWRVTAEKPDPEQPGKEHPFNWTLFFEWVNNKEGVSFISQSHLDLPGLWGLGRLLIQQFIEYVPHFHFNTD